MKYIDGFVMAVPNVNKNIFKDWSLKMAQIFKEYGALNVMHCWGVSIKDKEKTSFIKAVQCTEDETVVYSLIIWPSKKVHDAARKSMINDPRMKHTGEMPFEYSRSIIGEFDVIIDA